jgi:hypothetical protein
VFVSNRGGPDDIYTMDADGTHLIKLTDSSDHGETSPAGVIFKVYSCNRMLETYSLDADGNTAEGNYSTCERDCACGLPFIPKEYGMYASTVFLIVAVLLFVVHDMTRKQN